jgi:hypothetical protein
MARGFDDIHGFTDMDDDELVELIYQELDDQPEIDPDLIDVVVEDGLVRLMGRVGTEQEHQQVEAVVADVIGVPYYSNELVIDEIVRGERSEAADEEVTAVSEAATQMLGSPDRTSSEAEHLMEDLPGDLYGTQDMQRAISRGQTYEPPTRPIQEGSRSAEDH